VLGGKRFKSTRQAVTSLLQLPFEMILFGRHGNHLRAEDHPSADQMPATLLYSMLALPDEGRSDAFRELDVVRVVHLLTLTRKVDGTTGVLRQPRVGDLGTIVHLLGPHSFVVECVDADGQTAWVADFEAEELEQTPSRRGGAPP
jgi:hypothetical protein